MFSTLIEIGIIALFIINIFLAKRTKKLDLLIISTIFAAFFENLHVILFQNYQGGYYYEDFLLMVWKTPLFVILSWGIIILNAYLIATKLTNKKSRVFLIPVLALMVDLALEFFAVKQGYWTWIGYSHNMGLHGVPASNFISWMLITLALVFSYEQVKQKWLVPIVAYIMFAFMSTILYVIVDTLRLDVNQQAAIIWVMIILLMALTLLFWKKKDKEKIKTKDLNLAFISRGAFYAFAMVLITANLEFAKTIWPVLSYVLLTELVIFIAAYYKKRK
ncbi:MAG: carotenoid biosynthesis protein [Candidatus Nanoarchaeia archaeon]